MAHYKDRRFTFTFHIHYLYLNLNLSLITLTNLFSQRRTINTFTTSIQFRHDQILHLMGCGPGRKVDCIQYEFFLWHFFHATYNRCTLASSSRTQNHYRLAHINTLIKPIYNKSSFLGCHHNLGNWCVSWNWCVVCFEPRPPCLDHVETVVHGGHFLGKYLTTVERK